MRHPEDIERDLRRAHRTISDLEYDRDMANHIANRNAESWLKASNDLDLWRKKAQGLESELAQCRETIASHTKRWQADIKRLTERAEAAEAKLLEIAKLTGWLE